VSPRMRARRKEYTPTTRTAITGAYNALWAEHERIRGIHMKILAHCDQKLEQRLLRADLDDNGITMRFLTTRSDFHARKDGGF
jgi:hypothetical protein